MQWQFECDRLFVAHHAYTVFDQARSYVWCHQYDELGNRIKTVRPDVHTATHPAKMQRDQDAASLLAAIEAEKEIEANEHDC